MEERIPKKENGLVFRGQMMKGIDSPAEGLKFNFEGQCFPN